MNPIEIADLVLNLDRLLGATGPEPPRFPLLVTRDGEPEAVIIRHEAWAPKLQHFNTTQAGDLICTWCPGLTITLDNPYNLRAANEAANQHWRDTHREKR